MRNRMTKDQAEIIRLKQVSIVTNMLVEGQRISSMEMFEYGITRLAAIIFRMRQRGWQIKTDMVESASKGRYARYRLISKPKVK